jgi:NAD(P)-dependent dehydrogenase (short-subunit alcohol dehydrogenase family)
MACASMAPAFLQDAPFGAMCRIITPAGRRPINWRRLVFTFWWWVAMPSAGKRQLTRFAQQEVRQTSFPPIFRTQPARAVAKKAIDLGIGHGEILVNNAGIYPFGPTREMTEEQFVAR